MPSIARVGDPINCGDTIVSGSGNVFSNGLPVARQGDSTAGHGCWPPTTIATGSSTVFINNIPAARSGVDTIVTHCCGPSCHSSAIANGSPDAMAG